MGDGRHRRALANGAGSVERLLRPEIVPFAWQRSCQIYLIVFIYIYLLGRDNFAGFPP